MALVESCSQIRSMTKDVFTPADNETITIGQQTKSFAISLSESLLASLKMSRVRLLIVRMVLFADYV